MQNKYSYAPVLKSLWIDDASWRSVRSTNRFVEFIQLQNPAPMILYSARSSEPAGINNQIEMPSIIHTQNVCLIKRNWDLKKRKLQRTYHLGLSFLFRIKLRYRPVQNIHSVPVISNLNYLVGRQILGKGKNSAVIFTSS